MTQFTSNMFLYSTIHEFFQRCNLISKKLAVAWVFLFSLLLPIVLIGQYKFNHDLRFGMEEGFPSKYIFSIKKGKNGFLWLTTNDGLVRFDGSKFKTFYYDPTDSTSIADNRTRSLVVTEDSIWVGTGIGVSVLDLKTEKFSNYQLGPSGKTDSLAFDRASEIGSIYQDSEGDIWVGSRYVGIFRYDPTKDDFLPYAFNGTINEELFPYSTGVQWIRSFTQVPGIDSIIWAGAMTGLLEINKTNKTVNLYTFPISNSKTRSTFNRFLRMIPHKGLIYIGGYDSNIRVFNPQTKELRTLQIPDSPGKVILENGGLTNFLNKNKDEFWISRVEGLISYNPSLNQITSWKINKFQQDQFYSALELDDNHRIWGVASSHSKKIQVFDPFLQQYEVFSFAHLNHGGRGYSLTFKQHSNDEIVTVFPSNANGLFHLNKKNGQWEKTVFPHDPNLTQVYSPVKKLAVDPAGNLTLATAYGFFTYEVQTGKIIPIAYRPKLKYNQISTIFWDSRGYFWVGARADGLIRWNPRDNTERRFLDELADPEKTVDVNAGNQLLEDSNGNIWIRRPKGISVYLHQKDSILNILHPVIPDNSFANTTSFSEDHQGRLWVTGEENWIGYIEIAQPEMGVVKKINLDDYGVNGVSYMFRTDLKGNLWLANTKVLLEINPDSFSIIQHSLQYMPKNSENLSFDILPTGELVFGERNQILIANPKELQPNNELPIPYLTDIRIGNNDYQGDTSAFYLKELNLKYNQNFFSLGFSGQAFRLGKQTQFEYRLKDFEDWVSAEGGRNFANYTNVPSGDYIFQLQAFNNEGFPNPEIYELSIHIDTPWWATWWFKSFLLLAGIGIVYGIYRYRLYQIEEREKLKTSFNKKLADVEMSALLAQMNPHFLFNCLNSIDSYILKNKTKLASEYLNDFARLIRLILQNSRSNYVSLKDELETLELYIQMESLRLKDKFNYEIEIDKDLEVSMIDIPPMLIQPYVENAIWHGLMNKSNKKDGLLKIELSEYNGRLSCIVRDNGIGRKKAKALKADRNQTKQKSMGMSITQDRIQLINQLYNLNARVEIIDLVNEQEESQGTEVRLEIPV